MTRPTKIKARREGLSQERNARSVAPRWRKYTLAARGAERGTIRRVDGDPRAPQVGSVCYRAIHGRAGPCVGCPAFGNGAEARRSWGIVTCSGPQSPAELVLVKRAGKDVEVEALSLPEAVISAIAHAHRECICVRARLSAREREIVELILRGAATEAIASRLRISGRTVRFHQRNLLRNLLRKLGANSRVSLIGLFS